MDISRNCQLMFGVLFFFKYFNFVSESITDVLNLFTIQFNPIMLNLLLPVGISFYTFQTLSYVIDVYKETVPVEHHFGHYAAFISFFPQLVAGPVERTDNLLPQIKAEHRFDYDQAAYGLKLMAWGYFKKIVIADALSQYVSAVYDSPREFQGFALVSMVVQSLPTILRENDIDGLSEFYEYGWWWDYGCTATIDWTKAGAEIGACYRLDETLRDIQNIKILCNENNIELVVFINPMCEITYQASLNIGYLEFLSRRADITDYYNFSGMNDVTIDTDNYLDASHYNAYVGDMLIDVMVNGAVYEELYDQRFGWYVTPENVSELLNILQ